MEVSKLMYLRECEVLFSSTRLKFVINLDRFMVKLWFEIDRETE